MLNTLPVNTGYVNDHKKITNITSTIASYSFNVNQLTKYAFKTSDSLFFNFNNFELGLSQYGNIMESHNFDDIAEIDVYKYRNALKNGGTIYDRRYREKTFSLTITFISDTLQNLENEIRNLKAQLEVGGEFWKIEKEISLKINVKLTDFTVGRLRVSGTTVTIKMLTMDPFWSATSSTTVIDEGNVGSFNGSFTLLNSKIRGYVKHTLFLNTVTGTINQMTLTLGGFPIVINQTLTSGKTIILDGINNDVFLDGVKVKYLGQFPELEVGTPYTLTVTFAGGGTVNLFDLYTIYENKQL